MTFTTTLSLMLNIKQLIPQRSPIMMVDELLCVNGDEAQCRLAVRDDNFFLEEDGLIAEVGIIEHIAQSASAFAGYRAVEEDGATEPPVGYIGEVKNFHLTQRPAVGDVLITTMTMGPTVDGVTIISGECKKESGEPVADTRMKIYVP